MSAIHPICSSSAPSSASFILASTFSVGGGLCGNQPGLYSLAAIDFHLPLFFFFFFFSSSRSSYFCLLLRARPRRPRRRLLCSLSWGRLCILCCLRAPSFSATTATCSARSFSFKSSTTLLESPETRNSTAAVTAIRTIPDAGIFSQYQEAAIAASLTGSHGLCGRPRHRSIQNFIRNPSGMRRVRCR